jgi:hypothetical protein
MLKREFVSRLQPFSEELQCSSPLEPLKYDVHCQETGASRPVLSKVQWRVATQGPPLFNGLFRFQKTSYELSLGRTSQSSLASYQMKLCISCNPYCLSATRLASLNWEAWSVHSHVFQVLSENFFGCILQTLIFHSYSTHQRSLARSRFFSNMSGIIMIDTEAGHLKITNWL